MTELKTLKDLFKNKDGTDWFQILDPDFPVAEIDYVREALKAEAIKWVKKIDEEIEQHAYENDKKYPCNCWNCDNKLEIIKWIKHFFNLTAEDLK